MEARPAKKALTYSVSCLALLAFGCAEGWNPSDTEESDPTESAPAPAPEGLPGPPPKQTAPFKKWGSGSRRSMARSRESNAPMAVGTDRMERG